MEISLEMFTRRISRLNWQPASCMSFTSSRSLQSTLGMGVATVVIVVFSVELTHNYLTDDGVDCLSGELTPHRFSHMTAWSNFKPHACTQATARRCHAESYMRRLPSWAPSWWTIISSENDGASKVIMENWWLIDGTAAFFQAPLFLRQMTMSRLSMSSAALKFWVGFSSNHFRYYCRIFIF